NERPAMTTRLIDTEQRTPGLPGEACLMCVYQRAGSMTSAPMSREPINPAGLNTRSRADLLNVVRRKLELAILIDTAMCE
ncbi:MAG TPA: hypothetical protein VFR76_13785, partial [Verrucomicrobiae bacterium]|nr:hypothetical protein [Verrucomicrobiae bacterium]